MELAVFSEEELQKYLRVVARDFQIKFLTRQKLRQQEEYLSKLESFKQEHRGCALCPKLFSLFRRPQKCSKCSRETCSKCRKQLLCNLCITKDEVSYKRKEWSILCPYAPGTFGHAKFECKCFKRKNEDWYLRTMVELHICCYLRVQLDNSQICFTVISDKLKNAMYRLTMALNNFTGSSSYNQIDAALNELKRSAKPISIQKYSVQSGNLGYLHLLINAVIFAMISANSKIMMPETSSSISRTNFTQQNPAPIKMSENMPRRKKPIYRAALLQESAPYPKRLQLHQRGRVQVCGSNRSREDLFVIMSSETIEAKSGELVRIMCIIETGNEDFDVKWYHGDKELPNSGRFRALSAGFRQCLEIFDCRTTDQGEIVCAAINNYNTASDTVLLNVREEDIAAEEPKFIEPLTAEEVDGNLVLKCAVIGYPIPYLTFHRKNRRIHSNRQCIIERDNEKWTLTLCNCNVDDEGRYTAAARNRVGRTISCYRVFLKNKLPETYIADV